MIVILTFPGVQMRVQPSLHAQMFNITTMETAWTLIRRCQISRKTKSIMMLLLNRRITNLLLCKMLFVEVNKHVYFSKYQYYCFCVNGTEAKNGCYLFKHGKRAYHPWQAC